MIASKAGEVLTCADFAGGHALGVIMAFRPSNQPLHRSAPSSPTGPPRPPRRQPFSPTEFSRRSTALKTHNRFFPVPFSGSLDPFSGSHSRQVATKSTIDMTSLRRNHFSREQDVDGFER